MRRKISSLLIGLTFIVAGILISGNILNLWDVTLFFPGWWTLFIIVPSVISIVKNGFHIVSIGFLAVGSAILLQQLNIIPQDISLWSMLLPLILVLIGLSILFKSVFNRSFRKIKDINSNYKNQPEYTAIFGGQDVNFPNEEFHGTTLTAVFGGIKCDLKNAVITQNVVINITATFGGVDLYLPSDVKVKISSTPIFGGVSNKTMRTTDQNAPTVFINAICAFGGVDLF